MTNRLHHAWKDDVGIGVQANLCLCAVVEASQVLFEEPPEEVAVG